MPVTRIESLPDDSHVWIFGASSPLTAEQSGVLLSSLERFQGEWAAHGAPLNSAHEVRDRRFLIVAVEPTVDASGCSIDRLFKLLGDLERKLAVSLIDSGSIFYRDGDGTVHVASRDEFRQLASAGSVTPDSPVFDNGVQTLGDLRHGRWEKPASRSWHGRLMPATSASA